MNNRADDTTSIATATTALFVPGDKPGLFEKAQASGSDLIIIDLEDAVQPSNKVVALQNVCDALAQTSIRAIVRVNAADCDSFESELRALGQESLVESVIGVMVPKVESCDTLNTVASLLPGVGILALIESAVGIAEASAIAGHKSVVRLAVGAIDLSLDLDVSPDSDTIRFAFAHLVLMSRIAGIPAPLASPSTELNDPAIVFKAADEAKRNGFAGKLCIHPAQIDAVSRAFKPSQQDVDWARRIAELDGETTQLDGHMVDKPVVDRAKRILRRSMQEMSKNV